MGKNIFNSVLLPNVESNTFDLSHDVKASFNMGELVPTLALEVLPGDKFEFSVETLLRFQPLIAPVMHNIKVTQHYFFVPNRIVWPDWDEWVTQNSEVEHPYITVSDGTGKFLEGSLADYLGYPTELPQETIKLNPLPLAAYVKIWDEYYRDQNLQTERFVPLQPGSNDLTYGVDGNILVNGDPYHRAWMHDYFTGALPFAQKGDAVEIPLVSADDVPIDFTPGSGKATIMRNPVSGAAINTADVIENSAGPSPFAASTHVGTIPAAVDNSTFLSVDIQGYATDINTLRRAFRIQEWLERNARGGTRYTENILAHFGVRSSDARLQRPEYIGGSKQRMVISEVLSTAQTDSGETPVTTPVGNMAGHGISAGGGNIFRFKAEEHGWIIALTNVQPVTAYQQGVDRSLLRLNVLDYAWPTFANLGEQEIYNMEVMFNHNVPRGTFGYTPRYSDLKFKNSRVHGDMKTNLKFWHLGRIFETDQELNEVFITANPDHRIFAVTDNDVDKILAHIFNKIYVNRKLPRYGIPTI